jgi:FkbM family methyltransferase
MSITTLSQLKKVETIATASRLARLLIAPRRYLTAIVQRELFYRWFNFTRIKKCKLFWNEPFFVKLPAGTDIFISGGKTDDSELRLTKFIIKHLGRNQTFIDIGAHFGFYTRLAAECVGEKGTVYSFEPAVSNYVLLKLNTESKKNIQIYNKALSDRSGKIGFVEFETNYSEYDSLDASQYQNQEWFENSKYEKYGVDAISLDEFLNNNSQYPDMIKIDVEGGEFQVLTGAKKFLRLTNKTIIAMEYLSNQRNNQSHHAAAEILRKNGFQSFIIDEKGELVNCDNLTEYIGALKTESDNIIFKK